MTAPGGARAIAASCAFLALSACSGTFGDRVREQFQRTVTTGPSPLVRVDNVAGEVWVQGWTKPVVDVNATKYGYDVQELRNISIDVRPEEGGLTIATTYSGGTQHGGVRYVISVPTDASVRINNVAGKVELAGVLGNVTIETQAGAISANVGKVAGERTVDMSATTGAITLTIAPESSATVDASSTVGNFTSDVPGVSQTRENVIGARGTGTIGSGSARITLRTTTGAIALRKSE
jgi:DUF4097 and DUF4098 domain-containing protein YvlB